MLPYIRALTSLAHLARASVIIANFYAIAVFIEQIRD